MKQLLVDDWHRAWRWFSTQFMGVAIVVIAAWAAMPDSMRQYLPTWLGSCVAILALVCGIAGRLLKQEPRK